MMEKQIDMKEDIILLIGQLESSLKMAREILEKPLPKAIRVKLEKIDFASSEKKAQLLLVPDILNIVYDYFEIDIKILRIKTRRKAFVYCRQIAVYFLWEYTSLSSLDIGHIVNKHHATIFTGIKRTQGLRDTMPETRFHIEELNAYFFKQGYIKSNRVTRNIK